MTTVEERMQILKMIEEGKISAEEGARLLQALGAKSDRRKTGPVGGEPRWFRVRVTDLDTGRNKVNVNIPMGLVNVGIKMGARFAPNVEGLNYEEISEAIRYLEDPNFYTKQEDPLPNNIWLGAADDVIFRKRGIEFVDGTAPGFAAIAGAAPTPEIAKKIATELQEVFAKLESTLKRKDFTAARHLDRKIFDVNEAPHIYEGRIEPQAGLEQPLRRVGDGMQERVLPGGKPAMTEPSVELLLPQGPLKVSLARGKDPGVPGDESQFDQRPGRSRVIDMEGVPVLKAAPGAVRVLDADQPPRSLLGRVQKTSIAR